MITASCKSCGACASMCPENAVRMLGFSTEEIVAEMEAALGDLFSHEEAASDEQDPVKEEVVS